MNIQSGRIIALRKPLEKCVLTNSQKVYAEFALNNYTIFDCLYQLLPKFEAYVLF